MFTNQNDIQRLPYTPSIVIENRYHWIPKTTTGEPSIFIATANVPQYRMLINHTLPCASNFLLSL